jgi:hypothetical protein
MCSVGIFLIGTSPDIQAPFSEPSTSPQHAHTNVVKSQIANGADGTGQLHARADFDLLQLLSLQLLPMHCCCKKSSRCWDCHEWPSQRCTVPVHTARRS